MKMFNDSIIDKKEINIGDIDFSSVYINPCSASYEEVELCWEVDPKVSGIDFAFETDATAYLTATKIVKEQIRHNKKRRIDKKWKKKYGYKNVIKEFNIDSIELPHNYCCDTKYITSSYNCL